MWLEERFRKSENGDFIPINEIGKNEYLQACILPSYMEAVYWEHPRKQWLVDILSERNFQPDEMHWVLVLLSNNETGRVFIINTNIVRIASSSIFKVKSQVCCKF